MVFLHDRILGAKHSETAIRRLRAIVYRYTQNWRPLFSVMFWISRLFYYYSVSSRGKHNSLGWKGLYVTSTSYVPSTSSGLAFHCRVNGGTHTTSLTQPHWDCCQPSQVVNSAPVLNSRWRSIPHTVHSLLGPGNVYNDKKIHIGKYIKILFC